MIGPLKKKHVEKERKEHVAINQSQVDFHLSSDWSLLVAFLILKSPGLLVELTLLKLWTP